MKAIEELLKNLGRPEVLEFGLVTNRLPSVNIGGKFEPVDDEAPSTQQLLEMLVAMGGARYVEQLSERPVQWTTRLEGVGVIAVAAIMRKDVVQARFTVARRDPSAQAGRSINPAPIPQSNPSGPSTQVGGPSTPVGPPQARKDEVSIVPPVLGNVPGASRPSTLPLEMRRTQQGTGASAAPPSPRPSPPTGVLAVNPAARGNSQPAPQVARPSGSIAAAPPVRQSSGTIKAAPAASQPAQASAPPRQSASLTAAAAPAAPRPASIPPPEGEWDDDDDEPTVQTLSPPVNGGVPGEEPAVAAKAASERAAAEKAAESKAAEEKAAAEAKAAEERKVENERKVQERLAAERAAAERAAAEKRAAIERAASERAAAAERAANERKAQKGGLRISTPTSVDAVDVEITTNDSGSRRSAAPTPSADSAPSLTAQLAAPGSPVSPLEATIEVPKPSAAPSPLAPGVDPDEATMELQPLPRPATSVMPSPMAASAVPSTTPSAMAVPEKERPRADGSLESFLAMATAGRASDLHIIAGRPVLLRVATDLLPRTQAIAAEHVERMAREIVPARLRETLESEGACDFAIDHPAHGRFRVNVSRQRTGTKLSMRVVPREIPTLALLGLPEALGTATKYPRGLVLVSGPAGNGKTTTLAALVDILNRETKHHIVTVENPIEFVHPKKRAVISQREIGTHARSLAAGASAALRSDANVLVLGELRDAEAVRLALTTSTTGLLVFATVSAKGAAGTIDRLLSFFPRGEQQEARLSLANALRLVIGQRLVPSADRTRLFGAAELLPSSIALYTLIRDGKTAGIPALQQRGRAQVLRLDESLAELVRAQRVTAEIARQLAESPQELDALVGRSIVPPGAARKS